MGWFDDVKGALKKGGKKVASGADNVTDALIDKKAWKNTAQAMLDGPGGKEVRMADLANMALDSTMLIPGAGIVGGAARVGARKVGQEAAEATAKKVADRATKDSLRSMPNVAARNKVRGAKDDLVDKLTGAGGSKVAGKASDAARPLKDQATRIAAKQKAGVGTKVGFGQTKKRVLKTAAMTGGANAAARVWDSGLEGLLGDKGNGGQGYGPGAGGPAGAGAGGIYLVGADGSQTALPENLQKALAAFVNQGGSPDGSQVVHLGR